MPVCCGPHERAVVVQAHGQCGGHCDALSSHLMGAAGAPQTSRKEGAGLVLAIRAVRARCVELGHALQAADSLAEGAAPVLGTRRLQVKLL